MLEDTLRFLIASRIFVPEPSAASFRLAALAAALTEASHEVDVLTVRTPRKLASHDYDRQQSYRVRRFPVLRDRTGYVRGYLSYLSFDVPLFFRILFGKKADAIIVEPPPTTGFFVRLACALRRTPYIYYGADIWADAAIQTGAPSFILRVVAKVERWVWNGAGLILAVSPAVQQRLEELRCKAPIAMVGNGVDVSAFDVDGDQIDTENPLFVYGGSAAEWHGADIFVHAFKILTQSHPTAQLYFIGGGSEKGNLQALADELELPNVHFLDSMQPRQLSKWLRSANASLASVRPGTQYEFAFPTKLYGSVAVGAPLIYAGTGPAARFVHTQVEGEPLGEVCGFSADEVAESMKKSIDVERTLARKRAVSKWGHEHVDIKVVARVIGSHVVRVAKE